MRFKHSFVAVLLCAGCAARQPTPTTPPPAQAVEMDALRIVASQRADGSYEFAGYDAADLFDRADACLEQNDCNGAVALYDQLIAEFQASPLVPAALFNAGLCLVRTSQPEAAFGRFDVLTQTPSASPKDVRDAHFKAAHLALDLSRNADAQRHAEALLADATLEVPERVEAMALRARALLALDDLERAEAQSKEALTYYRSHGAELGAAPTDAAAASFVAAEVLRLRAAKLVIPDTTQEEQRAVLEARAERLLEAQRAYWDVIRHTDAYWASAAGQRIGALYDDLWRDLMAAPIPKTLSEGAREHYHPELAKLIKPLLRHAIRYWELTLLMVERTGVKSEWTGQVRKDLERVRALLIEQPAGPGGLPAPPTPAPASPNSDAGSRAGAPDESRVARSPAP